MDDILKSIGIMVAVTFLPLLAIPIIIYFYIKEN